MLRILILLELAITFAVLSPLCGQEDIVWPEKVDAFIELDEVEFEIFNEEKSVLRVRRIINFFNDKERDYGNIYVYESPFKKCKKLSAKILDRNGNIVKKTGKKD